MTILEAALDEGISLPHDCKLGVCLTCPSMVVSGEVDQSEGTLDAAVVEKVRLLSRGRRWGRGAGGMFMSKVTHER